MKEGQQYYLTSTSVDHPEFVSPKGAERRIYFPLNSNYFESTTDNQSVKQTFIVQIPGKNQGNGASGGKLSQTTLHAHI